MYMTKCHASIQVLQFTQIGLTNDMFDLLFPPSDGSPGIETSVPASQPTPCTCVVDYASASVRLDD